MDSAMHQEIVTYSHPCWVPKLGLGMDKTTLLLERLKLD